MRMLLPTVSPAQLHGPLAADARPAEPRDTPVIGAPRKCAPATQLHADGVVGGRHHRESGPCAMAGAGDHCAGAEGGRAGLLGEHAAGQAELTAQRARRRAWPHRPLPALADVLGGEVEMTGQRARGAVCGRADGRPALGIEAERRDQELPVRRVAARVRVVGQQQAAAGRTRHAHVAGAADDGASPRGRGRGASPGPEQRARARHSPSRGCGAGRSSDRRSRRGRTSRRAAAAPGPPRGRAPTGRQRETAREAVPQG